MWHKFPPDTLLSQEEFDKLLEEGTDAELWVALQRAAGSDNFLSKAFDVAHYLEMPRQRMLMMTVYAMVRRHQELTERYMELMDRTPLSLIISGKTNDPDS